MRIYNAQVVQFDRVLPRGGVDVEAGRITAVHETCHGGDLDLTGRYLLPGLIDVHMHPVPDDMTEPERLAGLCAHLRSHGTAAFLMAPANLAVAGTLERLTQVRACIEAVGEQAGCLGVHLEGPYVAEAARGGFEPPSITHPDRFSLDGLLTACGHWARYINISPETNGALDAIRACRERGLAVSIGHSEAPRERLLEAVEAGACSICHTFNTGSIMRYKEPGVLDVTIDLLGLASGRLLCEVICDGVHVDPVLVRLLHRAKGPDGVVLVTDSIIGGRAAREGEEIDTGVVTYHVTGGVGRNAAGGLVGSTLNMARALHNFVRFTGCGIVDAARAGATNPARLIGIAADYGSVAEGKRALFCVLDNALEPDVELCRQLNLTA